MPDLSSLGVHYWGALTPLGSASQTGFLLRAGKSLVLESPFIDLYGERIPMAFVDTVPVDVHGLARLAHLARAAFDSVLPGLQNVNPTRVRIAMAMPESSGAAESEIRRALPDPWRDCGMSF